MKRMLKRLAKWIVQHGLDELQKEIDRKASAPQPSTSEPPQS
jgi:hypothetical protein